MSKRRADVLVDSPSTATGEYADAEVAALEQAYAAPAAVRDGAGGLVQIDMADLAQTIKNIMHDELAHMTADIERRYDMALEAEHSISGTAGGRRLGASDLNLLFHVPEGYAVTSNSPSTGLFAWSNLRIVYGGVDYLIADGSISVAANKYVWFVKPASYAGAAITLQQGPTQPTLANGDTMVFVMNSPGVPTSALERTGSSASADPGSINDTAITGVSATKLAGLVQDAQINAISATKLSGLVQDAQINGVSATKLAGQVQDAQINGVSATKLAGQVQDAQIAGIATTKLSGLVQDAQINGVGAGKVSGTLAQGNIPQLGAAKLNILSHFLY